MKKLLPLLILMLVGFTFGQTANNRPKVFIAPMESGLNEFLTAALIQEKVPIDIIVADDGAEYVIRGTAVKGENKWYDTVFGNEKDRNQASVTILRASDKSIVWAGSAGDKSIWFPAWAKGGQRKVAERLAKAIKKNYFNGRAK